MSNQTRGILSTKGTLKVKHFAWPKAPLSWRIRNALRFSYIRGMLAVHIGVPLARMFGLMTAYGTLSLVKINVDGSRVKYGVVGHRVITTAFANFLTDQLQTESALIGDFKYHDSGVGNTAEAVGDTAIQTTDGEARVAGTQVEAAANVYRSVGLITYTTSKTIVEHGLFNDPTAGTLLDRTVFGAVNVTPGEKIEFDYSLTINAGG